jgi:hypothetical protein
MQVGPASFDGADTPASGYYCFAFPPAASPDFLSHLLALEFGWQVKAQSETTSSIIFQPQLYPLNIIYLLIIDRRQKRQLEFIPH